MEIVELGTQSYVSNENESVRLFKSDNLERLTKVHPATPLVIFVPVVFYFGWQGFLTFSPFKAILFFLEGLLFWTFFEYTLHRFVFHFESQKYKWIKTLHYLFHGIHHAFPRDARRLVMPPSVSIPLASLVYLGFVKVLDFPYVAPSFSGFMFGYLCYDMIHFCIHHVNANNKVWQTIKKHHYRHHYGDREKGFGVSSPLWDYIFRS